MALTKGDDYPIHQTSEPIAFAGTDRNFYDRYYFGGYGAQGDDFFAAAFGVYPHLNIADASFCIIREGVQTASARQPVAGDGADGPRGRADPDRDRRTAEAPEADRRRPRPGPGR